MIIWGVVLGVVVVGVVLLVSRYVRHGQHGGAGQGALSVRHLVERTETEASSSGSHTVGAPITMRGDLADDIADLETRILPLPPEVASADRPGNGHATTPNSGPVRALLTPPRGLDPKDGFATHGPPQATITHPTASDQSRQYCELPGGSRVCPMRLRRSVLIRRFHDRRRHRRRVYHPLRRLRRIGMYSPPVLPAHCGNGTRPLRPPQN